MSERKKFDLDKFVESLEMDDEIAEWEAENPKGSRPYRECPRCGSKEWLHLRTNKRGKIVCCTDCMNDYKQ